MKPSVNYPPCRKHGPGEGNTGTALEIPTELQQNNSADIGKLVCRVQASPLMVKCVSKLAVLTWKVLMHRYVLLFQ